ncbi:ProQ/FinO family protein [Comamonas sp. w2-DMI]|uniref:ProQ/FinO family protein n=1 Tax=Comamonas sp. w2-DMI TaxID=3126391 RepID=UPI0032E4BCAA
MTEIISEPQEQKAVSEGQAQVQAAAQDLPQGGEAGARQRARRGGRGRKNNAQGAPAQAAAGTAAAARPPHPVLAQLAQWHPALFGEQLLPLKRGIFEDLLAAHPELDKEALKSALQQHTRSGRYLAAMASGQQRHDLDGKPVEATLPEHVHHALIEVFRRRQQRSPEDLTPKLRNRIIMAYEASGLSREEYAERVHGKDEKTNALVAEALAEADARAAKDEALLRAYTLSGQSSETAFAEMYGMNPRQVAQQLERARRRQRS